MKNKIKAVFAATLAAIITLTGISSISYAADTPAEKLEWNFYDEIYEYDYAGELGIGTTEISLENKYDFLYYTVNAESSGYYSISYNPNECEMWLGIPEYMENGIAYNAAASFDYSGETSFTQVYFLEKGINYVATDLYYIENVLALNVDFLGQDIEGISVDEAVIINDGFYMYDESFGLHADINVLFDSGKSITVNYIDGTAEEEIEEGNKTLTAFFLDKEIEFEIKLCYISDFVADAEISNIENYLDAVVYYNDYQANIPFGETLTVTFTDGTKASCIIDSFCGNFIELPNGTEVNFCVYDYMYDGEVVIDVVCAEQSIKTYECNEIEASSSENLDKLSEVTSYYLSESSYCFRMALIKILECGSIEDIANYGFAEASWYMISAVEYFTYIFGEISTFIRSSLF